MKRSRFTEEQVIAILREHEAGHKTADLCRKHGISSATFYAWKAKFGGLDVSPARKLRVLEDENAKLKKLLAEGLVSSSLCADGGRHGCNLSQMVFAVNGIALCHTNTGSSDA